MITRTAIPQARPARRGRTVPCATVVGGRSSGATQSSGVDVGGSARCGQGRSRGPWLQQDSSSWRGQAPRCERNARVPGSPLVHATRLRGLDVKRKTILAALTARRWPQASERTAGPADAAVTSASIDGTHRDAEPRRRRRQRDGVGVRRSARARPDDRRAPTAAPTGTARRPATRPCRPTARSPSSSTAATATTRSRCSRRTPRSPACQLNGEAGDDVLTGADSNDTLERRRRQRPPHRGQGRRHDERRRRQRHAGLEQRRRHRRDRRRRRQRRHRGQRQRHPRRRVHPRARPVRAASSSSARTWSPSRSTTTTERFQVNGLGGNDSVTASDGVGARTLLSVDGGAGDDTVNGSDGPDLIARR